MMNQAQPFRLITIPISHFCEKARWALTRTKVSYIEEAHMPPFHSLATKSVGGKLTPVLVTDKSTFIDSTDILSYLDSIASEDNKIIPVDPYLRKQSEELEELFDQKLGIYTRNWGYSHIINESKIIKDAWCNGVPKWEAIFFPIIFPVVRPILVKKFDITASSSQQSYTQIQEVFQKVDQILADGRKYLVGDKFSIADLTFAALSAPIIAPPQHPKRRQDSQILPPQMLLEMKQMQETVAGQFALKMYANERF
jgi:glutathione S-transferase